MGLVLARLEEDGGDSLVYMNNAIVGEIPCDWDEVISCLHQLEGDLFGRHSVA